MPKKFCGIAVFILLSSLTGIGTVNADVVLNEIMYDPEQCSDSFCEWVEIYNTNSESVNLSGWTLCGNALLPGYINHSDGAAYLDNGMLISGNGFAVITDGGTGTDVYDVFSVNSSSLALHTNISSICGGLSNTEKMIYLNDTAGALIDIVTYSNSWGANGDNKSLERVDPEMDNWNSSINASGTPGKQNSIYAGTTTLIAANTTINNTNRAPLFETIPNQTWDEDKNLSINLSAYFSDPDGDNITYSFATIENISVIINNDIAILIPESDFSGIRYITFIGNDSDLAVSSNNITMIINQVPDIVINKTKYNGNTTDFSSLNSSQLQNITNMTFEDMDYGKILFMDSINLSLDVNFYNYLEMSYNKIEINSTALPLLNKSATLYLYNLTFINPRILRNNDLCPPEICTVVGHLGSKLIFNVTMFSSYSAEETPPTVQNAKNSEEVTDITKKCSEVWVCENWGLCKDGLQERNCNAYVYCDGSAKPVISRNCAVKEEHPIKSAENAKKIENEDITNKDGNVSSDTEEGNNNLITGAFAANVKKTNLTISMLVVFVSLAFGIYLYFFSGTFFGNNKNL